MSLNLIARTYNLALTPQNKMLLILIFILTVSNIWLVHGDEALVKQVCDSTPQPDVCQTCFKDAASNSNKTDLAFRSIACSFGTTGIVNGDLGDVADGSDDPAVKEKCAHCQQMVRVEAWKDLENAERFLNDGRFLDAANQVTAAIDKLAECSNLILGIPASPVLSTDFIWLRNLFEDTESILFDL